MSIRHGGLKGRELKAANRQRRVYENRTSIENETSPAQSFRLSEIEPNLVRLVQNFVEPLFELFDFCKFEDKVVASVVDAFIERMGGGSAG